MYYDAATMKKKNEERIKIEKLTQQYLSEKNTIKVIPYGVRVDLPKIEIPKSFKNQIHLKSD